MKDIIKKNRCRNKNNFYRVILIRKLLFLLRIVLYSALIIGIIIGLLFILHTTVFPWFSLIKRTYTVKNFDVYTATLNNANFTIIFITVITSIIGIFSPILLTYWFKKMESFKTDLDYVREMRKNAPYLAELTTAKIYYNMHNYAEADELLLNIPDKISYDIPLLKVSILLNKPHNEPILGQALKLLDMILLRFKLNKEELSVIYRTYGSLYIQEAKYCNVFSTDDKVNMYNEALKYSDMSIKEKKASWSAYITRAMAYKGLYVEEKKAEYLLKAIECLNYVLNIEPAYANAHYNLACYYSLFINHININEIPQIKEKAIKHFTEAIKSNNYYYSLRQTDPDLINIKDEICKKDICRDL